MNAPLPRRELKWRWLTLGGRTFLVEDCASSPEQGFRAVLTGAHHAPLQTRDQALGILRDLDPSDQVARVIANAPDLLRAASDLIHGVRLGLVKIESTERGKDFSLTDVLQRLIVAVEASGT